MTSPALSSIARGVPDSDLLRALAATDRATMERFIDVAITMLDQLDGDSDFEGAHDEDELTTAFFLVDRSGAGCVISDPDCDWLRS